MRQSLFLVGTTAFLLAACTSVPRDGSRFWGAHTNDPIVPPEELEEDAGLPAEPNPDPDPNPGPVPPRPDGSTGTIDVMVPSTDLRPAGDRQPISPPDVAPVGDVGPAPPASAMCSLKASVLTKTLNKGYSPRNVGALWIADGTGKFVKSLNVWGNRRLFHLERWAAATKAAGVANNKVDAVSAATLSDHAVRTGSWNCTDFNKAVVPDGEYQTCFEINETSTAAPLFDCVRFTKTGRAAKLTPPDTSMFTMRTIEFTP